MTITIEKNEEGYAVRFPYALLSEFKATFSRAEWKSDGKFWQIGPRMQARAEQWAAKFADIAERIELRDECDLASEELHRINAKLSRLESLIDSKKELSDRLEKTKVLLVKAIDRLSEVEKRLEDETRNANAVQDMIQGLLSRAVSIPRMRELATIMGRNMVPADRRKKEAFHEAQNEIREARERLKEAGIACSAINQLASANVNRPDRDHPQFINEKDWFNIWKIEQEG
jgi:DNA repair exonuclease SbcCD ATPase subunit